MENTPEENRMYQIQPYEALSEEVRALVDADVVMLHQMSDADILQYGWNLQDEKSKHLNEVMSRFDTSSNKEIDAILDDIMDSQKSVIPRSRRFFVREYKPSPEQKREFVGKVGELEALLKRRIDSILSNNLSYYDLISECKDLVDQYAICMMALDRYLAETDDMVLKDVLLKKKQSLASVRIANIQSALMYMKLYQNNALLANHLNEVIHLNLHQLQEQVLIQTETNEIKNALKECQNIKETIQTLSKKNIQELGNVGKMLEHGVAMPQAEEAEQQMQALLLSIKPQDRKPTTLALPSLDIKPIEAKEEKLKRVKNKRGLWNFQREDGSYVSPVWYLSLEDYTDDLAAVLRKDGRCNYMRRDGSILCKDWFEVVESFKNGFGVVTDEREVWSGRGKTKVYNVVNTNGDLLSDEWFAELDLCRFADGVIVERTSDNRQNVLLRDGDYLSNYWYLDVCQPDEKTGIYLVREDDGFPVKDILYSFMDKNGIPLTDEWFHSAHGFCEDVALVQKEYHDDYNYLKTDGKTYLSENGFSDAYDFCEGFGRVAGRDDKYNFLRKDGTLLLEEGYVLAWDYSSGFARVEREDRYQNFIDTKGHILSEVWYLEAEDFEGDFAIIKNEDGLYNFLTKEGKPLSKIWFQSAEPFMHGLSRVQLEDLLFNFLTTDGRLLYSVNRKDVAGFTETIPVGAVQRNNEKWVLIKKDGSYLDPKLGWFNDVSFDDDLIIVEKTDGTCSVLTPEGFFFTSDSYKQCLDKLEKDDELFALIEFDDESERIVKADGTPVYAKWDEN